jgi:hypothetical protein
MDVSLPPLRLTLTHVCYVPANAEDDFGEAHCVNLNALDRGENPLAVRVCLANQSHGMVLTRYSSGLFRAMFAIREIENGNEIHRRVSP